MKTRMTVLTGAALAALLLVTLSACDITVNWWTPVPEPDPTPEPGLTFSLEWTDDGIDAPHLYMTYPAPIDGDTTDDLGTPTFTEPYLSPSDGGDVGFDPVDIITGFPDETADERGTVYYGNYASNYGTFGVPAVEMTDVASTSEVIFVRGFPFTSSSTVESTAGGGLTGLATGSSYTWVGVMEVYAYATTGQLEYANGNGVNAVLNLLEDGVQIASYELPSTTDLKGASILRINCFYQGDFEYYQFVPDVRVIQSTTQIRSVAPGGTVDDSGVITIRRPVSR